MARKPKRKGRKAFRKYLRGAIDLDQLLGTLGAESLATKIVEDTVVEKAWCSSVEVRCSMKNYTTSATRGPILIGVAHSDYTAAEIEEWVENLGSWDAGDLRSQEIARRKIRQIGVFISPATAALSAVLNDGLPVHVKCGWMLQTAQSVRFWAYNNGSSALATTDPTVHYDGHANLWPA